MILIPICPSKMILILISPSKMAQMGIQFRNYHDFLHNQPPLLIAVWVTSTYLTFSPSSHATSNGISFSSTYLLTLCTLTIQHIQFRWVFFGVYVCVDFAIIYISHTRLWIPEWETELKMMVNSLHNSLNAVVGKLEKRKKGITLSMFRRGRAWHSKSCTCSYTSYKNTLWIKSWWAHRDFD